MLGVELGIMIGIALSIFIVIKQTSSTHVEILGNIPGTTQYKDISKFPNAERHPDILIVKVKDTLHFANVNKVKEVISRIERLGSHVIHPGEDRIPSHLKALVIHCESITEVDASAIQVLEEMIEQYHLRHVSLSLVKLPVPFKKAFEHAKILIPNQMEEIEEGEIVDAPSTQENVKVLLYKTVHGAVSAALKTINDADVNEEYEASSKSVRDLSGQTSSLMIRTTHTKDVINPLNFAKNRWRRSQEKKKQTPTAQVGLIVNEQSLENETESQA
jgi:MFS superfamily sulfate permease-like transporter